MSTLYEATLNEEGAEKAAKLARNELIRQPSLTTLDQLLQARAMADETNAQVKNRASTSRHSTHATNRAQRHWQPRRLSLRSVRLPRQATSLAMSRLQRVGIIAR